MTEQTSIDDISELDIEILKKLSIDGRISLRQLAKDLGNKSPVTIKNHVEKLESGGIIMNYGANINYEKLKYDIIALIELTISKGKMLEVELEIAKNPNIFAVYDITGEYDALILARFKTRNDLSKMIKKIHTSPYVERTNTHIVLNVIKEQTFFKDIVEQEKMKNQDSSFPINISTLEDKNKMKKTKAQFYVDIAKEPFGISEKEIHEAIKIYGKEVIDFLTGLIVVNVSGNRLLNRNLINILMGMDELDESTGQRILTQIKDSLSFLSFGNIDEGFNDAIITIKNFLGSETLLRWLDKFEKFDYITLYKSDLPDMPSIEFSHVVIGGKNSWRLVYGTFDSKSTGAGGGSSGSRLCWLPGSHHPARERRQREDEGDFFCHPAGSYGVLAS